MPEKRLEDRWSSVNVSWHDSLAGLDPNAAHGAEDDARAYSPSPAAATTSRTGHFDMPPSSQTQKDNDEDDEDAVRAEMERLKRDARHLAEQTGTSSTSVTETVTSSRLAVATTSSRSLLASSSLTPLPTSPTKSSTHRKFSADAQSPNHSPASDEETFQIRKAGTARASGRNRRVVALSDEEDENDNAPRSPLSNVDPVPSSGGVRNAPSPIVESQDEEGDASGDDDDAAIPDLSTDIALFMAEIAEGDDAETFADASNAAIDDGAADDPVGLFDDERDFGKRRKHKVCSTPVIWLSELTFQSLSKKDKIEMHKDIARAERGVFVCYSEMFCADQEQSDPPMSANPNLRRNQWRRGWQWPFHYWSPTNWKHHRGIQVTNLSLLLAANVEIAPAPTLMKLSHSHLPPPQNVTIGTYREKVDTRRLHHICVPIETRHEKLDRRRLRYS
jgi:hypothetical protein